MGKSEPCSRCCHAARDDDQNRAKDRPEWDTGSWNDGRDGNGHQQDAAGLLSEQIDEVAQARGRWQRLFDGSYDLGGSLWFVAGHCPQLRQTMIMRKDGTAADALASQVITRSLWQCACRPSTMRLLRTAECRPSALKLWWNRRCLLVVVVNRHKEGHEHPITVLLLVIIVHVEVRGLERSNLLL